MGTIVPNKEKTDAFNITRLYDHKNLWVRGLAMELKCIELYNATIKGKKEESKTNWEPIG